MNRSECGECGKRNEYGKCDECARGQYNDEGSTTASASCKLCAAGRFNSFTGRGTEGYCYFCKCGHWSVEGSNVCSQCPTGKYRSCPGGAASCDGGSSIASGVDAAPPLMRSSALRCGIAAHASRSMARPGG